MKTMEISDELPSCSRDDFRMAMRKLLGGVTLICTRSGDRSYGMTATAVCSVSADPPTLLVCLNRNGSTCAAVSESGLFSVNLLNPENVDLAGAFSSAAADQQDRFSAGEWTVLETGVPVLRGSAASFDCEVTEEIDSGSHRIFIGRVRTVSKSRGDTALGYFAGSFVVPALLSQPVV
ncbi:flavin reductase family protein [Rhizobium sp. BK060]|uniref:flavin reductase family protein n=1 Tax=Rhizobium sp. BK060 TaxID=2587096 RepID=UPI00160E96B6|nr:flavin reductase family protein [Rhizobium sp. BK060]MBB3396014.1 flavin reductase (DIM6/NTAB) family NADH-FMN oxidoreductase RutF [Rhizobium sp. BK060]